MKASSNTIGNIKVSHTSSYGRYIISGTVNGVEVETTTNDSEAYDWYNDNSNEEKQANAIAHCEWKLEEAYIRML
jgi:hypothetical protein